MASTDIGRKFMNTLSEQFEEGIRAQDPTMPDDIVDMQVRIFDSGTHSAINYFMLTVSFPDMDGEMFNSFMDGLYAYIQELK